MPHPSPFVVGRQSELELFDLMLFGRTEFRILNIYGPGGIGKTVVAQELASHAADKGVPMAVVDGSRPDLTPDRILYGFVQGLLETGAGRQMEDAFGDFGRKFRDYLVVNQVLQQGGGIQSVFDTEGNVQDPTGLDAILEELGSVVTEEVQCIISDRFALERYLRNIEQDLTISFVEGLETGMKRVDFPVVLLIDTYEEMEGVDDWVCRSLVAALPAGVYLVILGRHQLHKFNFDWNKYEIAVRAMPLPELGEAEAKAYLRHFGLTDAVALEQIYRYTGGYPLLLVLVRHLAREAGGWEQIGALESSVDRDLIATKLLERILREEQVKEVQVFLEKGVVARWFDPETIGVILEVNLQEARQIYDNLRRHSFVERHAFGLKFHDKIRELLLERLKFTSGSEYIRLTQRLMAYYAEKAGIEQPEEPEEGPESTQSRVQTGGGAYVGGDAEVGGDFVGRDQKTTTYNIHIGSTQGLAIGGHAQTLAEMLAFGGIGAAAFSQAFAGLLGLPLLPHEATYRSDVYPFLFDATSLFSGMKSLAYLPSLFIRTSTFLQVTVEELRRYLQQVGGPTHRIFIFIYLTDPDTPEQTAGSQVMVKKLQQVWAYDCVLLGREELREIVFSANPKEMFRKLVLRQVDLTNIASFVTGGPILAEQGMFFGREKELREITEHAVTANYAVIGGRRIGKTSILKRLQRVHLPRAGFRALYHDCAFTPRQVELVQAVTTDKSWFPEVPTSPPTSFASLIQFLPDDKPMVILLDEADKLLESDRQAGYLLFNTLRAMANIGRCRFILSGEQALRTELTNPDSPLYNFANEMLIGRLDFHAVKELITLPMKQMEIELEDEEEIVQGIWGFTSGHPNIVQRLCQRLIPRLNQRSDLRLTSEDVEAVVTDPDFLRRDFLNIYWERSTSLERLCSLVMATDERSRTLMSIHEALARHDIHATLSEVDDALERLVDLRNILQRTSQGYEFAVAAFPEVIAKTHRLNDLVALNCEAYQIHGDVDPRSK